MAPEPRSPTATLRARKGTGERIAVLTAYDVVFARLADAAGIDVVLVGDSLGMVVQGERTTLAVTLDEMVYHTRIVSRGVRARASRRRHAVHELPGVGRGRHARGGAPDEGGARRGGEAGGRRRGRRAVRRLVRGRDPGDGTRRADPAVGAPVRRVQGAGADRRAARADPRRRARARGRGRLRHRAGGIPQALAGEITRAVPR